MNLEENQNTNPANYTKEKNTQENLGRTNKDRNVFVEEPHQNDLTPTPEPEKKDEALTTFSNHFSGILNNLANSEESASQKLLYLSNILTHLKPVELIYKDTPKNVFNSYFAQFNNEVKSLAKICRKEFSKNLSENLKSIKKDLKDEAYASLKNRVNLYAKVTSEIEQLKNLPTNLVSTRFVEKVEKYHQKVDDIFSTVEKSTKSQTKETKEQTKNYIKELKESIKLNLEDESAPKPDKFSSLLDASKELEYIKNKTKSMPRKDIDKVASQIDFALRTLENDIFKEFHEASKQNVRAKLLAFDMINDEITPINNLQKSQNKFYSDDFKKQLEVLKFNVLNSFSWVKNLNNPDEEKKLKPDEITPSPDENEFKPFPDVDKDEPKPSPDIDEDDVKPSPDADEDEPKPSPDVDEDEFRPSPDNSDDKIKNVELEEECNNILNLKAHISMIKYDKNNKEENQKVQLHTPPSNFKKGDVILKGKASKEFLNRIKNGEAKHKILNDLKQKHPGDFFVVKNINSRQMQNFLVQIEANKLKNLTNKKIQKEMNKIQALKENPNDENRELIEYKSIKLKKFDELKEKIDSINNYQDLLNTSNEYNSLRKSLREQKFADWKSKKLDSNFEIDKKLQNWKRKGKADLPLNIN